VPLQLLENNGFVLDFPLLRGVTGNKPVEMRALIAHKRFISWHSRTKDSSVTNKVFRSAAIKPLTFP
jgi:hypothetical protein